MLFNKRPSFERGDIVSFYTDTLQELVGVFESLENNTYIFSKVYMMQMMQPQTGSLVPENSEPTFQFIELQMYSAEDGHLFYFPEDKVFSIGKTHDQASLAIRSRLGDH